MRSAPAVDRFVCPRLSARSDKARALKWQWLALKRKFSTVALAATTVVAGCNPFPETWEWNQKLTIEVLVNGETVSGSAVSHVKWGEPNIYDHYRTDYSGVATIVDLGERGMLFALIGEETKHIACNTMSDELGERLYEKLFPKIQEFRGTREVPRDRYPLLVTFDDIDDPATVKRVDPDNLAASFGPGVSLKRIALTITDEPVTRGEVGKVLGWLDDYKKSGLRLNGKACVACPVDNLGDLLGTGHFEVK